MRKSIFHFIGITYCSKQPNALHNRARRATLKNAYETRSRGSGACVCWAAGGERPWTWVTNQCEDMGYTFLLTSLDLLPKNWTKTNVKNLLKSVLHNQEDRCNLKKALKPTQKRPLVEFLTVGFKISKRRACRTVLLNRSTQYYRSQAKDQTALLIRLRDLAQARVRYGYRRLHVLLLREGWKVNVKRVYRHRQKSS